MSCPTNNTIGLSCSCEYHRCDDGQCVDGTECDGTADCRDGSDEVACSNCSSSSMVLCDNGECVDGALCDEIEDCSDGSDEDNLVCGK